MQNDPLSTLVTLRAKLTSYALDLAAMRLQVLIKANFNPAQLRTPAGHTGGGRWTREGGGVQLVADHRPPLRRIHPDSTYDQDPDARRSLDFWRQQPTDAIVESLKPDAKEPLIVTPDGRVWQGNTRIRVLDERGYDVNSLPRVSRDADPKSGPRSGAGRGSGRGLPLPPRPKPFM